MPRVKGTQKLCERCGFATRKHSLCCHCFRRLSVQKNRYADDNQLPMFAETIKINNHAQTDKTV
jgi:hypothetical protein